MDYYYQLYISNPATGAMERFIVRDREEAGQLQAKAQEYGYYASQPVEFYPLDKYSGLASVFQKLGVREKT